MELFLVAQGCPNCHGQISNQRLAKGLPCERCLPRECSNICEGLKKYETIKYLRPFCEVEKKLSEIEVIFFNAIGYQPSALQRSWIKRLLFRESFAIVAPTGTGKTTFGLFATLLTRGRVLVLVPTKLLVQQIGYRLSQIFSKSNIYRCLLAYQGHREEKKAFERGNFDVLVSTTAFFYRNIDKLIDFNFELIFIDDVDSFLRRSAHVDQLFRLLGFKDEEIALALKSNKTDLDFEKLERIRKRQGGKKILLISSATLKPRTNRVLLFRFLLGFEVYRAVSNIRNIVDAKTNPFPWTGLLKKAAAISQELGPGGLLFVAPVYGREGVEEAVYYLRQKGLRVLNYLELSPSKLMEEMEKSSFDLAVGLSHPTNPLVRGIDLPFILRHAIFLGVPRYIFPLKFSLAPQDLYHILVNILPILDEERFSALSYLRYLRRYLTLKEEAVKRYSKIEKHLYKIRQFLETKFSDPDFLAKLERSKDVFLLRRGGDFFLVVGDSATYLQASGRVSRLTASGLIKGLSIILTDDARALASLEHRLRFQLGDEFTFKSLEELDLKALSQELTEVRLKKTDDFQGFHELSRTTLVIVESPHKAKTIASFWGRPTIRRVGDSLVYEIPIENRVLMVTASLGHIFNLSRMKGFFGVLEKDGLFIPLFDTIKICRSTGEQLVDQEEIESRCPDGHVIDKGDLLEGLRRLAFEIDEIFIGSDPDAEGEKIAYDLFIELRPFNKEIKRVEFHEVTPKAFRAALDSPTGFNLNRVKAQLTRRVIDRWVGFTLSQKLWSAFGYHRLSAGRVQTPVLGWVIERAEEARKKKALLTFYLFNHKFRLQVLDTSQAKKIYKELGVLEWKIINIRKESKQPLPPYTTDTILEDSHKRLGLSTKDTMNILQELFEAGLITYHRTDSTRVSEAGRYQVARPYIQRRFGDEYFCPRGWDEGGAHEAIRPTRPREISQLQIMVESIFSLSNEERALRLYDLIFRRFIASQMCPTQVEVATILFRTPSYEWEEDIIVSILSSGFEQMYPTFVVIAPKADERPKEASLRWIPKIELFTEGSLVQEMKRRGLGRPSTYAEIVTTLIERHYVKVLKGGWLYPTRLGRKVYSYLRQNFSHYIDEGLTRELERAMDLIEAGELDYQGVLQQASKILTLLSEKRA